MERRPLFVFGTLRLGHENHHYLAGRFDRWLPAVLRDYRRVEPLMIDVAPGEAVDGQLFFLELSRYDETLAGCDELEEIPVGQLVGHEYERREVTVNTPEGEFTAWAYVRPTGT
jgi:gamma-glutamylcyclotransferase (GGCT)/AIG2-like uncharacterized protein YtfP